MEEVLDRAVRSGCKLTRNDRGLYDLVIMGTTGAPVFSVKNITFRRAMAIIENSMHQKEDKA